VSCVARRVKKEATLNRMGKAKSTKDTKEIQELTLIHRSSNIQDTWKIGLSAFPLQGVKRLFLLAKSFPRRGAAKTRLRNDEAFATYTQGARPSFGITTASRISAENKSLTEAQRHRV